MQILIGGIDRTDNFRTNSLEISDVINEKSTGRIQLYDESGLLDIVEGNPIQVYDNNAILIFSGYIYFPKKFIPIGQNIIFYDCDLVDNHLIADRFLVAETFLNISASDIVFNLFYNYLFPEGITLGEIDGVSLFPLDSLYPSESLFPFTSTVILERISFPRIGNVTDALNEIAEITGYDWYIDYDKKFYFIPKTAINAPFSIMDTSAILNINVRENKTKYRNRQYIRGGFSTTDTINLESPTPIPDGISRTFVTRFPLSGKPRIFVNSSEVDSGDIGVNGSDQNKKYYYRYNSQTITQDNNETVLTSSDTIEITYKGLFPIATVSDEPSAIAERASIEGGSGIYERIDVDLQISSREEALEIASGKLRKYTKILKEITFDTFTSGLSSGQLININLPKYNISSDFLIDRVDIAELDGKGNFQYSIHAVDGETFGGWQNFFKDLMRQNLKLSIRENEILILTNSIIESDYWSETNTFNILACALPSEILFPSESLISC